MEGNARELRRHVVALAEKIGGRSAGQYASLRRAADYIDWELRGLGYPVARQSYKIGSATFDNIEAERTRGEEIVVVGAHYDTAGGLPGANDNASGVAAGLELARLFAKAGTERTVRWVFFANEEPPYFMTDAMGSYVYAKRCKERKEDVRAMLALETIGYYSDAPGSQQYPSGLGAAFPDRGNFLGFVADLGSAKLLERVLRVFRKATTLPAEGAAAPAAVPGVGWSDHWSFWQFGYPALMVTDTAPFRYPHHHTARDTPDKVDYDAMARAVTGLAAVVRDLAGA